MKKITRFLLVFTASISFFSLTVHAQFTPGEVTFTVRTITDNGNFAPKHVLAIWVEDANGFVKTRKVMAQQRKQYLYTWKAASNYNEVDAITGPTMTSHQTHTVSWDCRDLDDMIVPDGDYTIWVEFTEKHAQGPLTSVTFTKSTDSQVVDPQDEDHFADMHLEYTAFVGMDEKIENADIHVYPNPTNGIIYLDVDEQDVQLSIYALNGSLLLENVLSNGLNQVNLSGIQSGIYLMKIHTSSAMYNQKLVIQ